MPRTSLAPELLPILILAVGLCSDRVTARGLWGVQPPLPLAEARIDTASSSIERELAQIDSLVEAQAWEEATDGILRLVDEGANELVAVSKDYYLPLRDACQLRISRWPAAALEVYRGRVDAMARSRLERALQERSEQELERVARDYFCSRSGDDALAALGEWALERGDPATARGYWQQISPALVAPDGRSWGVALVGIDLDNPKVWEKITQQVETPTCTSSQRFYPDSDFAVAHLLARLAVASIREGSLDRAQVEAELLRRLFPEAKGRIAGREALLSEAVAGALSSARHWPTRQMATEWPTFGGDNQRGQIAAPLGDLSHVAWSHVLPSSSAPVAVAPQVFINGRNVAQQAAREALVEPVVAKGAVLFRSGPALQAIDLKTGGPLFGETPDIYRESTLWPARALSEGRNALLQQNVRVLGGGLEIRNGVRGRVVIRGGAPLGWERAGPFAAAGATSGRQPLVALDRSHVFATLGPRDKTQVNPRQPASSRLLALDLVAEGKLALELSPDDGCHFCGPPVVADDRIYLPMRQSEAGQRLLIAGYSRTTGRQLWRTAVCSFVSASQNGSDILTLGDRMLYLNTNAGVIVAVRTEDGQFAWGRTYQRANSTQPNDLSKVQPRPPGPCLLAGGALLCAPSDAPAIFALDPTSGRTLWTNKEAFDVSQLLGVVDEKLIATGKRLWAINVVSGKPLSVWPDSLGAGIEGSGRGCIAGDEVFWPTKKAIYTFNVKTGEQSRPPMPINKLGGDRANLIPIDDNLIVATRTRLTLLDDKPGAVAPAQAEKNLPDPL